ncbi:MULTISPECIES: helix-turn-helix domain-containing protein [Legionella]|uniref:helix-turn-helix domain-containing protein n=1 Tax=Legionella TaxID=445 RepID=UPI0005B1ED5E|nr:MULTISPECIES: helix-turn-helix domain-containing protein [Legionella]HAT8966105.1 helix-turn-helix domain-containing protein [Legionella pneumophila subsp. pneumophila]ARB93999.1 DNA-binding protein [Legionella longbeachae]MDW9120405.1 helix-turn-helix domain-containing protein [Legionella pneumophila]RZV22649.1 DNA-binding protein [Legionella longbeachae]UAK46019.1 helix-turn-helix domain-containing protein [Legionella longbeachae]
MKHFNTIHQTYNRTLNINEASIFLGTHKETLRRKAAKGELPAVKIGRSWIFIEQDLVMYIRSKYATPDASEGVSYRSNQLWPSKEKMVTGGLISPTLENVYEKALKLR